MFHINGPSGSGKTTLGNRLAKLPNVLVIDTDDIDDPNSMRVISKFPFEDSKDERAINMEIGKMNKTAIDKIVKENKGKTIIFVGFFHNGMRYLEKKIEHGYAIDIDAVTLWKHYNLRSAIAISRNHAEIEKLLGSKMYFKKIHFIFSKKFGVRNGFDCNDVEDMKEEIKRKKKRAAENGYVYATVDEIYDMISKHCLKK